jgi:hypothetical protein
MDFAAGLPSLVASLVAVVVLTWLSLERRGLESNLRAYAGQQVPQVTARLDRTNSWVRKIVMVSTVTGPLMMAFSGQLDEHGIANACNGLLQIIAPFTSACVSAAVAWALVASALVVHAAHVQLLELFRCPHQRKEFW